WSFLPHIGRDPPLNGALHRLPMPYRGSPYGDSNRMPGVLAFLIYISQNPAGQLCGGFLAFQPAAKQKEFVSPHAADHVPAARGGLEHRGDLLKNAIALYMAVGVVDAFKVIQIHHKQPAVLVLPFLPTLLE